MNGRKLFPKLLRLVVAVGFICSPGIQARAEAAKGGREFQSAALNNASAEFAATGARAKAAYAQALDSALKAAMTATDLPEANAIAGVKTAIEHGKPLPPASFKSSKAAQAKTAYDAAMTKALGQYTTLLQNALKSALTSGNLSEANKIQDEIRSIGGTPDKGGANSPANETPEMVVTGKGFEIATLQDNTPAFANRGYVWQKVPTAIRGWRYTKTNGGGHPEIKVSAKRSTVVQVITDIEEPGIKMSGWERTGIQFTYNNGKKALMVVFKKKLEAGQQIDIPQGNWCGVLVLLPNN